jgi:hypothetical protein
VVEAFFQALSPLELNVYEQAVAAQQAEEAQVTHAHQQRLSRLRYEAGLAQRQFMQVDPENRLVAAELEKRCSPYFSKGGKWACWRRKSHRRFLCCSCALLEEKMCL